MKFNFYILLIILLISCEEKQKPEIIELKDCATGPDLGAVSEYFIIYHPPAGKDSLVQIIKQYNENHNKNLVSTDSIVYFQTFYGLMSKNKTYTCRNSPLDIDPGLELLDSIIVTVKHEKGLHPKYHFF